MNLEMHKWLMDEALKHRLHKESPSEHDVYGSVSKPYNKDKWRLFVREKAFDKEFLNWLESIAKDCNLEIDRKLKKDFLVIC